MGRPLHPLSWSTEFHRAPCLGLSCSQFTPLLWLRLLTDTVLRSICTLMTLRHTSPSSHPPQLRKRLLSHLLHQNRLASPSFVAGWSRTNLNSMMVKQSYCLSHPQTPPQVAHQRPHHRKEYHPAQYRGTKSWCHLWSALGHGGHANALCQSRSDTYIWSHPQACHHGGNRGAGPLLRHVAAWQWELAPLRPPRHLIGQASVSPEHRR